ncbi:MAG TPA: hypothetical protein VNN79_17250, partial [Actinomycetota bacterium]|nr:hypothetical protein [Actinomycetota bacterium]
GATITKSFTGTEVDWIAVKGPRQGRAAVDIDGRHVAVVNNYSTRVTFDAVWRFGGLANGPHTITIRVLGTKGSPVGRGTAVTVDGFRALAPGHPPRADTGPTQARFAWASKAMKAAYGGAYDVSSTPGASVSLRFHGTGIAWRTVVGPEQGDARVLIDGVSWGVVHGYAARARQPKLLTFTGLSNATHRLQVVVLGTGAGAEHAVAIDGFLAI